MRNPENRIAYPERPKGELVWIHLGSSNDVHKIHSLTQKMIDERGDISFVITSDCDRIATHNPGDKYRNTLYQITPLETTQHAREFLTHWAPDAAVWLTAKLRPALIVEAADQHCPLLMMGIESSATLQEKKRGNVSIIRDILPYYQSLTVVDDHIKAQFLRQGARPETLQISGCLGFDTVIPPCQDFERDKMAALLSARPVWMAHQTIPSEIEPVIAAHRSASRLAHRLLLVITPNDPSQGHSFARALYDMGWQVALRSNGDLPQEDTQIMVADLPAELGLWLRLSPVCFHGNTLTEYAYGTPPFDALALGASILHGPKTGEFTELYERIGKAGAARLVENQAVLSTVVGGLLAPDKAAKMAHAGWELSSQSAEATDQMVALLHDVLDKTG